jgi:hypothetical protein
MKNKKLKFGVATIFSCFAIGLVLQMPQGLANVFLDTPPVEPQISAGRYVPQAAKENTESEQPEFRPAVIAAEDEQLPSPEPKTTLIVVKSGNGRGLIQSSIPGIDCGDKCVSHFKPGTEIKLLARAANGSVFDGFKGNEDCVDGEIALGEATISCEAVFSQLPEQTPTEPWQQNRDGVFSDYNVGIGTSVPKYPLQVEGHAMVSKNVIAKQFFRYSDRILKTNVAPIANALQQILSLNGVTFTYRDSGTQSIGLIAQEVENIFPQAVVNDEAGLKTVDYAMLVAPLIEAVKQQQEQIGLLEQRISELER